MECFMFLFLKSPPSRRCIRKFTINTLVLFLFFVYFVDAESENFLRHVQGQRRLQRSNKPNIILILTDDQDVELGSMEFMPKTLRILRDGGAEFVNGFVTTPLCCPSRSSILTGMYVHNHNVHSNNENCTGQWWITLHEPRTVGVYLQNAGYRTGYFGKYLNEYNGTYIPVGWHDWMGLVKNSRFYNYTINFNGVRIKHGDNYDADYFTDLVANDTLTFMRHWLLHDREKPFFVVTSFPAPHGPEDPAPHYSTRFTNVTTHRTPSWNYAPNPDKQWLLQHVGKMEPVHVAFTDFLHRRRLQTLLSVDDAIRRIYEELRDSAELNNTFFIFTSDHGYHLGQFGLIKGKTMPYDFDVKVPYYVRGPGVGSGARLEYPVANIDVAPTILDIAGCSVPEHMDGRSLLPLLYHDSRKASRRQSRPPKWRHTILIERGLRPKLLRLRERLQRQKDRYDKDMLIQNECDRPRYKAPCKSGQQWECRRNEIGRWRIFKCGGEVVAENDCTCAVNETQTESTTAKETVDKRKGRSRREINSELNEEIDVSLGSFVERIPLSVWERIVENDEVALVSEEQLQEWEDEFVRSVLRASNGARTRSADEDFESGRNETSETIRRKRNTNVSEERNGHRSRHFKQRNRSKESANGRKVRGCALYSNHTVHCRPEIYRNYDNWLRQKYKVDDRIRSLRNRLQDLKGVRKHLKAGKPSEQDKLLPKESEFWTSVDNADLVENNPTWDDDRAEEMCTCGTMKHSDAASAYVHPLRQSPRSYPSTPANVVSDAELLAYAEERRRQRAGRKKADASGKKAMRQNRRRGDDARSDKAFCNVPNLNCFTHDNTHWRTPPYWTLGPFCFCQNSNNNTYWCLRTVNATHDFLYCEFVTGFISYYDITKDRYQLNNAVYELSVGVIEQLSAQLEKLRTCRGSAECEKYGMT